MSTRRSRLLLLGVLVLGLLGAVPPVGAGPSSAKESSSSWLGFDPAPLEVVEARVARSQTFVDLVQQYGLEYPSALQIARDARSVFDVREIRAHDAYQVYVNPWLQEAQYLVYQASPSRHVVFNLQRPSETRIVHRPVETRWALVETQIDGSLYGALLRENVHPVLVLRLSEVFAWQVDFFRIREGDSLRVLYEQRFVEGEEKIAPGNVIAAYFKHRGTEYYGFRFDDGNGVDYFNAQGQSLRRELLKAPLEYTRISSGYSHSRYHPILKERRPHRGVDYAAPPGTPVRAVGDGVVQVASYRGANGNYVKVRHNSTYTSGYLHLSSFAKGIRPGARVQQGETIGYVGSTGRSTGPHLDYRLWKRGQAVNPTTLDLPPSRPVRPDHYSEFRRHVKILHHRLHRAPVFAKRPSPSRLPWS